MHSLERTVLANVQRHSLAAAGDTGIVAVSGGADSVALLNLLHALGSKLGTKLEVLHFNHGLREESPREAEWVADLASNLGLRFHLRQTCELKKRKGGLQEAAREWRRAESSRLMGEIGAQWAATGHHLDDQLETILLKLMRGSHLANLRGMDWRSGGFVRPLLNLTHSQLIDYLKERGAEWIEDPSNKDPTYKRNRVRNELLPLMEDISGGGIAARLEAMAAQSESLDQMLRALPSPEQSPAGQAEGPAGQAEDPAGQAKSPAGASRHWISADQLRSLPELAATTALHGFITGRMPGALDHAILGKAVEMLHQGRTTWELHLSNQRTLRRAGERLILEPRVAGAARTKELENCGWRIEYPAAMRIHLCESPCGDDEALLLYNMGGGGYLQIRPRKDGDRFHPPWKNSPVKLKDFLRDQHVPTWQRDNIPCVLLDGVIVAVHSKFVAHGFDRPDQPHSEKPPLCLHLSPW